MVNIYYLIKCIIVQGRDMFRCFDFKKRQYALKCEYDQIIPESPRGNRARPDHWWEE